MKNNQIITNYYYGHEVEITITEVNPPIKLDTSQDIPQCIKKYLFKLLEENITDSDFSKHPITGDVYSEGEEIEVTMKGSWRVITDYSLLYDIFLWKLSHLDSEALTEAHFIKAFGESDGKHFFSKWYYTFKKDNIQMAGYFTDNPEQRRKFYYILQKQVNKFTARTMKTNQ